MMQEWFSLLNGKNELIKRQIELNLVLVDIHTLYMYNVKLYAGECGVYTLLYTCREREEDLEKKQFFINRELRPLMEIPGQPEIERVSVYLLHPEK